MMRPLNLQEFAEQLRIEGNPFADEILVLCTLEEDIADPYSELCDDLDHYIPEFAGKPQKQCEWLGDRSQLLHELEKQFKDADRSGDIDDAVREVLDELQNVETIMREHGGWTEGDLQDALFALIERAGKPMEYDL